MSGRDAATGIGQGNDTRCAELENFPVIIGVRDFVPVRKSTSESSAIFTKSFLSAMTRPCWPSRAVKEAHRHAVEQAKRPKI